jgi:hypothetical protein
MILMSIITCPHCGHAAIEQMPLNVCQIFYDCRGCGARLKQSLAIVACSVLTVRFHVHRSRPDGPVCRSDEIWLSVVRNIQKNIFTARFGNFDHRIGR